MKMLMMERRRKGWRRVDQDVKKRDNRKRALYRNTNWIDSWPTKAGQAKLINIRDSMELVYRMQVSSAVDDESKCGRRRKKRKHCFCEFENITLAIANEQTQVHKLEKIWLKKQTFNVKKTCCMCSEHIQVPHYACYMNQSICQWARWTAARRRNSFDKPLVALSMRKTFDCCTFWPTDASKSKNNQRHGSECDVATDRWKWQLKKNHPKRSQQGQNSIFRFLNYFESTPTKQWLKRFYFKKQPTLLKSSSQ